MPEPKSGVLPLHHEGSVGFAQLGSREAAVLAPSEVGDHSSKTAIPTEVTLTNPMRVCGNVGGQGVQSVVQADKLVSHDTKAPPEDERA